MSRQPPILWRPSANLDSLRRRAAMLQGIRGFFADRGVLEVETPQLSRAAGTDPHLETVPVPQVNGAGPWFLHTSPEFPMKRLLAAGSGPIYQVCKVFRGDESGRRHNPEFTMLEWYRPGFDEHRLMDEVSDLVCALLGGMAPRRLTYREMFQRAVQLDPHGCRDEELREAAGRWVDFRDENYTRDDYLHLLQTHVVEPSLPPRCFIHDYPSSQAALAKVEPDGQETRVARRFELFISGMEIANGYYELSDPEEQRNRLLEDQAARELRGRRVNPLDENFLAALQHGLPDCAGVALGVDRLLMVATGADSIQQVLAFPSDRA